MSDVTARTTDLPPIEGPTTLRAVFPDAPTDRPIVLPIERTNVLDSRHLSRWMRRVCLAIFVAGVVMFSAPGLFLPLIPFSTTLLLFAVPLLPLVMFGVFGYSLIRVLVILINGHRLKQWATERGFHPVDGSWIDDIDLGLCQSGHTIHTKLAFRGHIADLEAVVGGYTWVRGSGKHRSTGYVGLIVLRLPPQTAERFHTVVVRPAGHLVNTGLFSDLQELRFESQHFDSNLQVLVADDQDLIPCYELFNPPFLKLLEERPDCHFEQKGEWLALPFNGTAIPFSQDSAIRPAELDGDCALAVHISRRFCDEHR